DNSFDVAGDRMVAVTTTDDDSTTGVPGLVVNQSGGSTVVSETGTTDTFTVALTAQPTSNVVLNVASSDMGEAVAAPAILTFTPANWNIPQVVTVTGVNDSLQDGNQVSNITISVDPALSDNQFGSAASQTVPVTTLDDDIATPAPGTAVVVPDVNNPGSQMLVVTGTRKNDTIRISTNSSGNLVVRINGQQQQVFAAAGIDRIQAFGQAGNDTIQVT